MKFHKLVAAGLSIVVLTGCGITHKTYPYFLPTNNYTGFPKEYRDKEIGVGEFTAKVDREFLYCSSGKVGWDAIGPGGGETFTEYVRNALISELAFNEVYSDDSQVTLSGHLNEFGYTVNNGIFHIGELSFWKLSLTVKSSNGESLTVSSSQEFVAPYYHCKEVAQEFVFAVKKLMKALFQHEDFGRLVN